VIVTVVQFLVHIIESLYSIILAKLRLEGSECWSCYCRRHHHHHRDVLQIDRLTTKTCCGRRDRVVGVTQVNSTTISTKDLYKSASVASGSRYYNTQVCHGHGLCIDFTCLRQSHHHHHHQQQQQQMLCWLHTPTFLMLFYYCFSSSHIILPLPLQWSGVARWLRSTKLIHVGTG